jgi:cardiolipin synthase
MLPDWIHTAPYTGNNQIELLRGGKPFFDALETCIRLAREELHVQVYIFQMDETGTRVLGLLKDAVRRGVKVYLLADAFGSANLSRKTIRNIRASGIRFRFFGRFFSRNLSVGRRLHHKIIVADGKRFLLGGMNIADRYNDFPGQPAWLDFGVQVDGPLAWQARNRCQRLWEKKGWRRVKIQREQAHPQLARLVVNDWLRGKSEITTGLRRAIRRADHTIDLAAAYFIPTRRLMAVLRNAARRGVRVRILLGRSSDVLLAQRATRYLYNWMLSNGIEIFEWTPTVMHAKVVAVDGAWASVGSCNLNFLSLFESVELNLEIADTSFAQNLTTVFDEVLARECEQVTDQVYASHTRWTQRAADWLAYAILWLLAHIFFFLDRKKDRPKGDPGL